MKSEHIPTAKSLDYLGEQKIKKLYRRMAFPSVIAQIVNLIYNMVDRIYVGHISGTGEAALTSIGVCMPLVLIIGAFAQLSGTGGADLASIYTGMKDSKSAEKILGSCTAFTILLSAALTTICLVFAEPLLWLFGASADTLPYAKDYMVIYVWGTLFTELSLSLVSYITAQGFALISMFLVLSGVTANVILDPIFIFGLHMGVKGAALATVISQGISALGTVIFLTGKRAAVKLRLRALTAPDLKLLIKSLALGVSPFTMAATESLVNICFNRSLLFYGGDQAVGAMSIFSTVMQAATLPLQGLAKGAQPILGYNYGASKKARVSECFQILLRDSLILAGTVWLLTLLFPGILASIITSQSSLIAFSKKYMKYYTAALIVMGGQYAGQYTFLALGNAKTSFLLALFRKIILLVPLICLMPLGAEDHVAAVFLAEPITDVLAAAATLFMLSRHYPWLSVRSEN